MMQSALAGGDSELATGMGIVLTPFARAVVLRFPSSAASSPRRPPPGHSPLFGVPRLSEPLLHALRRKSLLFVQFVRRDDPSARLVPRGTRSRGTPLRELRGGRGPREFPRVPAGRRDSRGSPRGRWWRFCWTCRCRE